ncbi:MAG: hypothetical protein U0271_15325 [Polyangiaceae bacterium]
MALVALALPIACTLDPQDSREVVVRSANPQTASRVAPSFTINVAGGVHLIEVERCAGTCTAYARAGLHFFEPSSERDEVETVWTTGVGTGPLDSHDGRPNIQGAVTYGVTPGGAGFATTPAQLETGATYAVNAYRFEPCEDESDDCYHQAAIGGGFFVYRPGASLTLNVSSLR